MKRIKKISAEEFVLNVINKALELVNSDRHFVDYESLRNWTLENPNWYDEYEFPDEEIYNSWKAYFLEHFYDHYPKRISKRDAEREFGMFSLSYGFPIKHNKD